MEVKEAIQPNPIEPLPADDPAVLTVAPSTLEDMSATLSTTPAISEEESVTLVTAPAASADEPANSPTLSKTTGDAKKSHRTGIPEMGQSAFILYGSIPCNQRDLRWHCHNSSSSQQKRAWCLLEEEQQALRGTSSSALSGSSPEPAPQEEEDPGAKLKALPLGFQEIAKSLATGKSPKMEVDSPLTGASQELLAEPTVATVISTTMCQDQTTGAVYLSMVTTSMGLMNLEAPSVAVGCQVPIIEELTEEDLAEGHP